MSQTGSKMAVPRHTLKSLERAATTTDLIEKSRRNAELRKPDDIRKLFREEIGLAALKALKMPYSDIGGTLRGVMEETVKRAVSAYGKDAVRKVLEEDGLLYFNDDV